MRNNLEFFVTCPKGIEGLLLEELRTLGAESVKETVAGTNVIADLAFGYRCCLWSRLANRVLLILDRFPADTAQSLYDGMRAIDWREHLTASGTLAVDFSGTLTGVDNTHFGALKVKDAIVDALREADGTRPSVDKIAPHLRVNVHCRSGQAQVAIDLSGNSLHQRGYRLQQGAAPLKENLAAAILIRAGWPQLAKAGGALADPMCGSGTFLVEAALMAADVAPNLHRVSWGFSRWLQHVPTIWEPLLAAARDRAEAGLAGSPLWIRGYEADPRLLQPVRNNIQRAGLNEWVKVYQGELATFAPSPDRGQAGLIVTNPPYGERLGDTASLVYLYQKLGEVLRERCQGWQAAIFTGNPDLGKRMGIRSHKQYALFNGAIPCKLLMMDLSPERFVTGKAEPSGEATRETSQPDRNAPARLSESAQMFANRLRKNLKLLGKWARQNEISCYRLYDADMPEFSVAIDLYDDWAHVQEYAAPATISEDKAQSRLQDVLAALPDVLGIPADQVVLKQRQRQAGKQQYQRMDRRGQFMEVNEGRVRLLVNLTDYLDTGLFLDHRPLRLRIASEAAGKRFLNLFCYTASASVHAAAGGARRTTSVDLSRTYLDWARRNLSLNGLSDLHQLVQADVMQWLEEDRGEYELIFIDPPTFSNSKRLDDIFDVQRDHVHLINLAMARLTQRGVMYFSNNFRRFKLDEGLQRAYQIEDISAQTLDRDFQRNTRIHKTWRITRRE
ncbi:bifunctional 23S rRNA (guanine(2069)-N(7))-methyltransferase RlmK/23S rRNA (guanine(2445)-N(2))-methyltransferase RlmL [Halopseudomonas nanhaiensis]|uniref:bifunctional 23S rRNA (guanine(2069)-N(7))-methyltransferase RlmK/23S rRNA (guanine(2445)-N(2))-methyltransferase RlmL n=1 Tax=Halopseudomonas nanhaiensis TaxID=2830842 RepID=UPI001CC0C80E|nr:bifunctional 23S rRNA (guanine(2069)-N(7))-methyltransferase RlmK/23S rRNA (guanine(2445)-N(2))-methyltransferase RlmL [Halopseudomonas nanhaiensis]UAW97070.1 bifunctional 23S rRNA (guanine(2069)-N(7))-methyltransferase RlmK/23S rRNA (guanine(2445)-N(2))-methyltransferase RlmL [Halopseudomonas nanhaiensis]